MGRDIKKELSIGVKSNRQLSLGAGLSAPETKEKETNSVKESLLARATQNDSKNLVKELYRSGSKIGDGGTADALRYELKTGKLVGGKSHKIKAEERVKQIIVDKLGVSESEVTPQAPFSQGLGADSLDTVELIMEFEKQFDIKIPDDKSETIQNVGDAIKFIEEAKAAE